MKNYVCKVALCLFSFCFALSCGSTSQTRHAETWQLSGSSAMYYEEVMVPAVFSPWAKDLIRRVALNPGQKVLDIACGTGIVARLASQVTGDGSTTGLDFNQSMIDEARSISERSGLDISWIQGDALNLEFEDNEFDTVFCQQGLQFFPDKPRAAREMHRVLRPGGKAAISVWTSLEDNPYGFSMVEALDHHINSNVADGLRSPFRLSNADSLRLILEGAGFSEVEIQEVEIPMSGNSLKKFVLRHLTVLPTASEIFSSSPEAIDSVAGDVERSLQRFVQADHYAVPWRAHVAVAIK